MEDRTYRAKADVIERDGRFELWLDLPGVPPEQLKVDLRGDLLEIEGRPKPLDGRLVDAEYGVGTLRRRFRLGQPVQPEAIETRLSGGVLRVSLPPCGSVLPEEIEVH